MRYVTLMMLSLTFSVLSADEAVLMDEDFTQLPDQWVNEGWTFNQYGAKSSFAVSSDYKEEYFGTYDHPLGCLFVPDGTDSLVVMFDHYLQMEVTSMMDAGASATLKVWRSSTGWSEDIYSASTGTFYEESGKVVCVMHDPEEGGLVGFRFKTVVGASGMVEHGSITWAVHHMTVTAYGSSLPLVGTTWGDIKSIF